MRIRSAGLMVLVLLITTACTANEAAQYKGTSLNDPAPDFTLLDQGGTQVSLSDFQGQVVVLAFFDSQCVDTCPLTAYHFRQAALELNDRSEEVVFMAVNVNLDARSVEEVAEVTEGWGLDELANWHYLTGEPDRLQAVWEDYHIGVTPEEEAIMHSSGVYLIDRQGVERWYLSGSLLAPDSGDPDLDEVLVFRIRQLLREK